MTTRPKLLMTAALIAPLTALAAQSPAPDAATMQRHEQARAQHREERARDLAVVLRLTPAQQPALTAWLQSMAPPQRDRHRDHDRAEPATTPERLAAEQRRMAAHQAEAAGRIAATQTFYALLDTQQRAVFDALGRLRQGEHHGMHGHGMGGHEMHADGGAGEMTPPGVAG